MDQSFERRLAADEAGERLDVFVSRWLPDVTRSRVQNLLSEGMILVDGKTVKAGYKLKTGNLVQVVLPQLKELSAEPEAMDLEILYEDDDLAIVNKPRGLVVHPAAGHESGTLVNGLLHHFQGKLSGINGVMRPGIVHRIDKDTSGLLVICKSDRAHQGLSDLLKDHDIERVYHAVVHGSFSKTEGTVDAPIGRMDSDRKKMCVRADGRRAITHYRVLEQYDGFSYVELRLETGRTHQIRVQFASRGMPLVGERKYSELNDPCEIALWSYRLAFIHPKTGKRMEFTHEPPVDYPWTEV